MRLLLFPLLALATVASPLHSAEPGDTLMPNGDFESGALGSANGWTSGKGASVEEEDGNKFLRLQATEPGVQVQSYRKIKIPAGTPKVKVSFRVRYDEITPGAENWHTGRVVMHFKDSTGAMTKPDPKPFAFKGKSDGWSEKSVELDVPEGSVEFEFLPALFQVQMGTLDIDDVVIVPAD
jgi:hypothetical protein